MIFTKTRKENKNNMILTYIAGSYTSNTIFGVKQNILKAEYTAMEVCKLEMNIFPLTPHLNTPFGFERLRNGQYFIDGTMELMLGCKAVLLVQKPEGGPVDYENSVGTMGEITAAKKAGIPVFYTLENLREWAMFSGIT